MIIDYKDKYIKLKEKSYKGKKLTQKERKQLNKLREWYYKW